LETLLQNEGYPEKPKRLELRLNFPDVGFERVLHLQKLDHKISNGYPLYLMKCAHLNSVITSGSSYACNFSPIPSIGNLSHSDQVSHQNDEFPDYDEIPKFSLLNSL
jgi:hypothetical protein